MTDFALLLQVEHKRSLELHPPGEWHVKSPWGMVQALTGEVSELSRALMKGDIHGPHGALVESVHVANVARRIYDEIARRHVAGGKSVGYALPARSVSYPAVVFDGYAVYQALSDKAKARTSAENVSDVLDAVADLIRQDLQKR